MVDTSRVSCVVEEVATVDGTYDGRVRGTKASMIDESTHDGTKGMMTGNGCSRVVRFCLSIPGFCLFSSLGNMNEEFLLTRVDSITNFLSN